MPSSAADPRLTRLATQLPGTTPELLLWMEEQLADGLSHTALLQALRDAGWRSDIVVPALQQLGGAKDAATTAASQPLPGPDLAHSPSSIDVGDREVHVLMALEHPRIVLFGNLLSSDECEALIAAAEPRMRRSLTVATQTGGEEVSVDRTSQGMFFQRGETPVVARLEARIARLLQWPLHNGEGLQVLHYGPHAEYKPHHDYFDPAEPGTPTIVRRGGQRVGTLVVYLNEPEQGGGTSFPESRLVIQPRRGNAVFFSYAEPDPATLTLHGGAPVLTGHKWIATKWLRQREFV